MNSDQAIASTYSKITKKYTESYFNDKLDLPYLNILTSRLADGAKILEVGCGPGTFTQHLIDKFEVEGVDISDEMLNIARKKVPKAVFRNMNFKRLTYPDASFNAILSAYSLIHVAEEEVISTLQGFYKVLKKDGYIFLMVQEGEKDQWVEEPLMKSEKMFMNFFTIERLRKDLIAAGFKVEYEEKIPYSDPENLTSAVIYMLGKKK